MNRFGFCLVVCAALGTDAGCAPPSHDAPPANSDFELQVEVKEALEGGPLVLEVTLTYKGRQARRIVQHAHCEFHSSDICVDAPEAWGDYFSLVYGDCHINPRPETTLQPGDKVTQTLRLHRVFHRIPAGKVVLPVSWHVCERASGKEQDIAWATTELELDIPAATPDRLDSLRKRMEARMRDRNLTYNARRTLEDDLLYTHHPELAPVAWEMLASYDGYLPPLSFLEESGAPCEQIDARVVKLLKDPNWPGAYVTFSYWDSRKTPLSDRQFARLLDSPSVWTRALTYSVFGKRCGLAWRASLMENLRGQTKPIPAAQLSPFLAGLDSDDFDVREQASARLTRLGERVEAQLRQSLDGPLSAEARRRVTDVLDRLRQTKQPEECIAALEHFELFNAKENGEILQVLAEGQPDAWLTHQAKEKLAQWRKDRGPPDK